MNFKKKQFIDPSWSKRSKLAFIQHRITQATYKNQSRKIRNLQRLLIKSLSARIQTILIASQIKNKDSFFFNTLKRKSNNYPFGSFLKNNQGQRLIKQKKYSINANFVKKFSLIFSKKFFYYFLFFFQILRKKAKDNKDSKKKEKINQKSLSKHSLNISLSPLFLLICHLVFSPVIETLLQEKKEKIFRNSLELILFLKDTSSKEFIKNSCLISQRPLFILPSTEAKSKGYEEEEKNFSEALKEKKKELFLLAEAKSRSKEEGKQKETLYPQNHNLDLYTKQKNKRKLIYTWMLKLEINGFYDHSNNSWLYENFPIESMMLKPLFKLMVHLSIFFEKKINSRNKKLKHLGILNPKASFRERGNKGFASACLSPSLKKEGKDSLGSKGLSQGQKQRKKRALSFAKVKILKNKSQLFHKDFFRIWNNLSSKKNFFENFCTNFENFFNFCLIGLENYLKKIFYIFNNFYFSEWHSQFQWIPTNHVFYFPRFIYLTELTPRQFQRIKKFLNLFLKHRGLYLKSFTYFNFKKGVNILGWDLKTKEKDLIVKVSESFCNFQKKEIKWLIKNSNQEPIHKLIVKLNNKIKNDLIEYENQRLFNILNFQNIETLYNDLNFFINQIFWKWAKKKHNNRSNNWIFQKYWQVDKKSDFLFSLLKNLPRSQRLKPRAEANGNKKISQRHKQKETIKDPLALAPFFKLFFNKKKQTEGAKKRIFVLLYSNESWKKFYGNFFLPFGVCLTPLKTRSRQRQNKNLLKTEHFDKKDAILLQEEKPRFFLPRLSLPSINFFLTLWLTPRAQVKKSKRKEKGKEKVKALAKNKKNKKLFHYFNFEYSIFNKYQSNLYFLNFYSLDFQTQYFFYIFFLP